MEFILAEKRRETHLQGEANTLYYIGDQWEASDDEMTLYL